MNQIKVYLMTAALAVALLVGVWASWSIQKGRVEAANQAASASAAEAKGLRTAMEARALADAAREKQRATIAAQTKENHEQLETALGTAPVWAAEPVPAAVLDRLRNAARGGAPGAP